MSSSGSLTQLLCVQRTGDREGMHQNACLALWKTVGLIQQGAEGPQIPLISMGVEGTQHLTELCPEHASVRGSPPAS